MTEVNGDTCWGFEYDIETAFDAVRAALNAEKVDE